MVRHSGWAIAGAYIGTVVGAGFASGQETLQFFTAYGPAGAAGVILATVLFAGFGVRVLVLGRELEAGSHRPLIRRAVGERLAPFIDGLLTLFLLATAAAMVSGAAATVTEQFGWPRWQGAAMMTIAGVLTVLRGIRSAVAAIAFVAPMLIVTVLGMSIFSLVTGPGLAAALRWQGDVDLGPSRFWWLSAGLYVAFNMVMAVPVLGPLGVTARDRSAIVWGGILGGIGLGLGTMAVHLAIASHMPAAGQFDIPILFAVRNLPPWATLAYSILLLGEVYTTAVAMLFGFGARLGEEGGARFKLAVIGGAVAAFIGGQFPFAELVGTVYPLMGILGVLLLAGFLRSAADGV